ANTVARLANPNSKPMSHQKCEGKALPRAFDATASMIKLVTFNIPSGIKPAATRLAILALTALGADSQTIRSKGGMLFSARILSRHLEKGTGSAASWLGCALIRLKTPRHDGCFSGGMWQCTSYSMSVAMQGTYFQ